jgi:hypothetical protein
MKHSTLAALLILAWQPPAPALAQGTHSQNGTASALSPHLDSPIQLALASSDAYDAASPVSLPLPKYGRWVTVSKWVSLAAAVGLGTLGAIVSEDADDQFARLQQLCSEEPEDCRSRNPDGSYANPILEQLYQDVLSKDAQARAAFIGAEVAFGASVVLFIVDFQKGGGPENEPYNPDGEKSRVLLTAKPGEIGLRYYIQ